MSLIFYCKFINLFLKIHLFFVLFFVFNGFFNTTECRNNILEQRDNNCSNKFLCWHLISYIILRQFHLPIDLIKSILVAL